MEKKEWKISLVAAVLVTILIILIIFISAFYYLNLTKLQSKVAELENEKNILQNEKENLQTQEDNPKNNETKIEEDNNSSEELNNQAKTTDLVTLYCESTSDHCDIFYAFIEDGELYYFNGFIEETIGNSNTYAWFLGNKEEMKKYPNLNNIKKIQSFNLGTSIQQVPFIITSDGKVYRVERYSQNKGEIQVELYDPFKDYKVEDIISHDGEMYDIWEILLKDGTTKTVTIKDETM